MQNASDVPIVLGDHPGYTLDDFSVKMLRFDLILILIKIPLTKVGRRPSIQNPGATLPAF